MSSGNIRGVACAVGEGIRQGPAGMLRRAATWFRLARVSRFVSAGSDIHVGAGCRFWAPDRIVIGNHVYVGRDVTIETNAAIGDHVLIASRVGLVGRRDHDYGAVGVPIRFSPWVGSKAARPQDRDLRVVVEDDVWIGCGTIVLSGTVIQRGSIVGAGSVVSRDVPKYSIVAGNPARVVGSRFERDEDVMTHEEGCRNGEFWSSERGFDHFVIRPGERDS